MSDVKTFSDYEKMYFDKIKDKTVGELLANCSFPDTHPNKYPYNRQKTHFDAIRCSGLDSLSFKLRKDFFDFALTEKGFCDLPILGCVYDQEDFASFSYAVQELFKVDSFTMYKFIYFDLMDNCFVTENLLIDTFDSQFYGTIQDLYLSATSPSGHYI